MIQLTDLHLVSNGVNLMPFKFAPNSEIDAVKSVDSRSDVSICSTVFIAPENWIAILENYLQLRHFL